MPKILIQVWFGMLLVMPFTCILTFIVTMIICSQTPKSFQPRGHLPEISDLGTGQAHNYFMGGFIILIPQLLIMFIGRMHFLIVSQSIIRCIVILSMHFIPLISSVFILIMAIVSENDHPMLHLIGASGTFLTIALYCIFHTIIIIYLFIRRSEVPEHSNVIFLLWFLVCTIVSTISSIILAVTITSISEYIAVGTPFLYFLGFVPSFWRKFNESKHDIDLRSINIIR
ncbi:unnamed protein product [Rotaria magnacalcarata]|uniref:CWH43-like N-terminal domain-containing protein n=1 Tax=Rotaria magnacalcarata TaxID=392030 RepID=A0A814THA3_9BILA|nr:unnamed protein product [Rotaria magnacalcarata]CAF2036185.1 unnamed protein product [Rotaria magnacalcarata]CAF2236824.1 unnamed protein product [Rotaria magnacalcarata]CAF4061344.1 unnamed protein product [Rotaria magnacalcarata]CAF4120590.1 unnamed protein product [Rotaria magnacalcarata]